ncbi:MAG: AraC family transcriptional regulator [Verrucomicrobia bacterium]|nr:AraC family transcriptional regulator [Verrucomicrobiota bacterium]MBU1735706.1 AraC family transcriptional regulator [Verrucomicrobiota bacterium]MBU1856446.1 AraC family transcriptional regulator [Verrucomicrobiota bacterium]
MKKTFFRILFRPTPAPAANLPFGARSVGHYLVPADYREHVAVKHFVQVFWGIAGTGALVINGVERKLRPRQIAVYFPNMRHEIYALGAEWEYCWWTMDGSLAASVTTAFGLVADVYDAGDAPLALLRRLENTIRNQSQAAERQASAIAYQLLTLAVSGRRTESADHQVSEAIRIIHSEWNQSQLCVKQLADRLHLHRSSLSRRFEKAVGIPPVAYLVRLRVQNALSMLKQTEKPITEVAELCGYNDPNYFSRLMRRYTGFSPRRFRSENTSERLIRT